MNSRAFLPFRNPVRLICIILLSGFCNTHTAGGERGEDTTHQSIQKGNPLTGGGGVSQPHPCLPLQLTQAAACSVLPSIIHGVWSD